MKIIKNLSPNQNENDSCVWLQIWMILSNFRKVNSINVIIKLGFWCAYSILLSVLILILHLSLIALHSSQKNPQANIFLKTSSHQEARYSSKPLQLVLSKNTPDPPLQFPNWSHFQTATVWLLRANIFSRAASLQTGAKYFAPQAFEYNAIFWELPVHRDWSRWYTASSHRWPPHAFGSPQTPLNPFSEAWWSCQHGRNHSQWRISAP